MFEYYGGKGNLVRWGYYPTPQYSTIVEPFAGAARYALRYAEGRRVILVEKNPILVEMWKWLQTVKDSDFLKLPMVKPGEVIPEVEPRGAQYFLGFTLNQGSVVPHRKAGKFIERVRSLGWKRYLHNLKKIREWEIIEGDYSLAPDIEATWFIDPPYSQQKRYPYGRDINYEQLSCWCRSRKGQVIVCENASATWLPFRFLLYTAATQRKQSKLREEGIWTK